MAVTIATLEARARINRDEWTRDRAAIQSDINSLSQQLDRLFSRVTNSPSRTQTAAPQASTANTGPITQTEAAVKRLTQTQREALDPVLAQARGVRELESDIRNYTRVLGDAHPATLNLVNRLNQLQAAQVNSGQQSVTFRQQIGQLLQQMQQGEGAAIGFGRGLLQSVGGISLIAGGAAAAGAAVAGLAQQLASMAAQGVAGNASIEQYNVSFRVLLGSADAASKRIAELIQFANVTPFRSDEIVAADRILQTFGGSVLATGKNLELVGDIASGTNRRFEDVALWVGRMYDALQSGRPWGEAAQNLQQMGALTGATRARIEELQKTGASGTQIWAAFREEMSRFNGMMQEQSRTAIGLSSTLQDLIAQGERTATRPLFQNAKQQLEILTGPASQQQIDRTSNSLAALFTAGIPAANMFVASAGLPVLKMINELGDGVRWLDTQFGVLGHQTAATANDMYLNSSRAFVGITDFIEGTVASLGHLATQSKAAAIQYSESLRQMQTASRGGEGGPSDARGELAGHTTPPPPGFSTWQEFNQWNSARNSIIDQTNAAVQQANISKQQANNQQYLTAQLQAQNAQAQAQAAIDRLKVSDQTFLQGQVSAEITQTQLQTAIDRVKLGNRQLQDATIAAEIAQTQVETALSRVKANNSALLGVQVEAGVAQTQMQTALTRAQSGSQAFIDAQIANEKAQRDAQDKLDVARKAAGLIDETAAERRAHERQITSVEFVKQLAQDRYDTIKAGIDSIAALSSIHVPTNIDGKIRELTTFEGKVLDAENELAARFSKDEVTKLFSFSQAANEGMGYFAQGVTALGNAEHIRLPDAAKVKSILEQANEIVAQVGRTSGKYKIEDLAQAGVYAETGQKITAFLDSTASAFEKIQPQRYNLRGQINLVFENIDHALTDLAMYSKRWKVTASDEVRDVADNVAAVMGDLNTALDPLTKLNQLLDLDDSTIDLAFESIKRALDRFSALADSPALQGQALNKLQSASDVLGSVFTGLKIMTDTLTGLTDLADATGGVDLGADLDQFFFTQVPAYADSWESMASRVGNSTVALKQRMGLPNAAAGGGGSSGSGNTYILNVNGTESQLPGRAGDLLRQLFAELELQQGGVQVGT